MKTRISIVELASTSRAASIFIGATAVPLAEQSAQAAGGTADIAGHITGLATYNSGFLAGADVDAGPRFVGLKVAPN